jgi:hypothetical protein
VAGELSRSVDQVGIGFSSSPADFGGLRAGRKSTAAVAASELTAAASELTAAPIELTCGADRDLAVGDCPLGGVGRVSRTGRCLSVGTVCAASGDQSGQGVEPAIAGLIGRVLQAQLIEWGGACVEAGVQLRTRLTG